MPQKPPEPPDDPKIRVAQLPYAGGIECPACGCVDSEVLRTRRHTGFIMRERRCRNDGCEHRWTTTERKTAPSRDEE